MTDSQLATINIILLSAMVLAALWTVITVRLLAAVVGLALTSAAVSVLMFMLNAPLAAVFELSVCAGLIPAIFLSAISVTKRIDPQSMMIQTRERMKKFWPLPLIIILAVIALSQIHLPELAAKLAGTPSGDVRNVMWNMRHMDLLGQIVVLIAGAFGVVVLLKEPKHE